jgi:hypothetical protein
VGLSRTGWAAATIRGRALRKPMQTGVLPIINWELFLAALPSFAQAGQARAPVPAWPAQANW